MIYSGTTRDLKRSIVSIKAQNKIHESFKKKINELKKKTDIEINKMKLDNMFSTGKSTHEEIFKKSIIGLQTQEQFLEGKEISKYQNSTKEYKKNLLNRGKSQNLLTFTFGHEKSDLDDFIYDQKKSKKNPLIDTSFLPDVNRDKVNEKIKKELRKEFTELQE